MKATTYISLVSFNKKYAALIFVQVLFLSAAGGGVYVYDQYFPDTPLGDQFVLGSEVTDDNTVHWLEKTHPQNSGEPNSNLIDTKNSLNVYSMDTDHKITSFTLMQEQNNHISTLDGVRRYGTYSYGNDLYVLVLYPELNQFPIIFKISHYLEDPTVLVSVLQLDNGTSFNDMTIDQSGNLIISSYDTPLWATSMDAISVGLTYDQFISVLGKQNVNSSSYLTQINLGDIQWTDFSDNLPIQKLSFIQPLYDLDFDNGSITDVDPELFNVNDYHRNLAKQLENVETTQIAEILSENLADPHIVNFDVELPYLYHFTSMSVDSNGLIHGQGISAITNNGNYTLSEADYFIVDLENKKQTSWDLVDTPLINRGVSINPTIVVGDTVFYINTHLSLDLRSTDQYPFATYDEFLNYYVNADRDKLQLAWFQISTDNTGNLSSIGYNVNQPDDWVSIHEWNFVYPIYQLTSTDNSPYTPSRAIDTQLRSYRDSDNDIHIHYAFGDVPEGLEGENPDSTDRPLKRMGVYSVDVDLSELGSTEGYKGEINTIRAPQGDASQSVLTKHGLVFSFAIRQVEGELEFLYFYRMIVDPPLASNYVRIVNANNEEVN